ncbi:MAG: hypothetical protein GXO78_03645 [Calditrichaeota bacterium]|nr:hypothetical protein [Calditrichota bacterium]
MIVSAQVSLYPLRQQDLTPFIDRTIRFFQERGLQTDPGPMSTLVTGPVDLLFDAIKEAFKLAAKEGQMVLVVTYSNACPVDWNEPNNA